MKSYQKTTVRQLSLRGGFSACLDFSIPFVRIPNTLTQGIGQLYLSASL